MLDPYLRKWGLTPAGEPIVTHTSQLLPVLSQGQPAMLKVTDADDERHGHLLMRWWAGNGAAQVLAYDDGAILLERATGPGLLVTLANEGLDAEATQIICDVARQLHARGTPSPSLVPLTTWFEPLAPMAQAHGGILAQAAAAAAKVLASQREIVPLHADLHHENILDFEERGWLAIDPKRVIGERTFEYTILFCDPDLGLPDLLIARRSEIFGKRLEVVSKAASLETRRLLRWILAWAGLSAAWQIGDDLDPGIELQVAEMALAALNT